MHSNLRKGFPQGLKAPLFLGCNVGAKAPTPLGAIARHIPVSAEASKIPCGWWVVMVRLTLARAKRKERARMRGAGAVCHGRVLCEE